MDTLDDLLIATGSEAYGRFIMAGRDGRPTEAWRVQESLTSIVKAAMENRGRNYTKLVRRRLTQEINVLSKQAIDKSLDALDLLEKLECRLETVGSRRKVTYNLAVECLPISLFRDVLRVSSSMRAHPASLCAEMEAYAKSNLESSYWEREIEHDITVRRDQLSAHEGRMLRRDANIAKENLAKKRGDAVRIVPQVLKDSKNPMPPFTFFLCAIEEVADNQALSRMGKRYESLGRAMTKPFPLARNATDGQKRQWDSAWRTYEECGEALAMIGIWIRNLGLSAQARRCDLCYRHIHEDNYRRCAEHKRASDKRVKAIENHTGRVYQEELKKLRKTDVSDVSFADVFLPQKFENILSPRLKRMLKKEEPKKQKGGMPKELVRQAVVLRTMLHGLEPLLGPELKDLVGRHFMDMVAYADLHHECFETDVHMHSPYDEVDEMLDLKKLDIRTFLWTWFGKEPWCLGDGEPMNGKGLDPSHPILRDKDVIYSRIKLDFLHFRAWLEAKKRVRDMYIDPDRIKAMRQETDVRGKCRTYASIATELGISTEAVRKVLLRGSETSVGSGQKRRSRVSRILKEMRAEGH